MAGSLFLRDSDTRTPSSRALGKWRYVRLGLIVAFFTVPVLGGLITFLEVVRNGEGDVTGLQGVSGVVVSPDGENVYASGRDENALVALLRNSDGLLAFDRVLKNGVDGVSGLGGASSVAISPDGARVYVTGSTDNTLVALARDVTQDTLAIADIEEEGAGGVFGMLGPSAVAVSPDNRHVFVAASTDDSLLMFLQDPYTQTLQLADVEINNHGSAGLTGASDVAISPDGKTVYVTGEIDDSVAVFTRDASRDSLAFYQNHIDGFSNVQGLDGASGIVVSPDGRHVYATGREGDAVALFDRDSDKGGLNFVTSYRDGQAGVDGIDGASAVTISPDGSLVFVAGQLENSVAVFIRDTITGELTFFQALRDGIGGVDGIAGTIALAVSPDALHIYVAGQDDSSVAGFRVARIIFFSDFESGNVLDWNRSVGMRLPTKPRS